ncbi:MAG: ion channel activity [Heterodermia speciosa]|uniref:Ion channel activity n=1 Tax=Heterodermia speciosa TaxID=116794 RepID=A0A8H3EKZ5_9LECA|nr:MAG: ion channel activity [Heterodermia speciosa]
MTVSTVGFVGLSFTKPRTHRIFHYITSLVTMVAAIAYFTMGANLGFTPIAVEFPRGNPRVHGNYRSIFYVRYIDWVITTPLLLLDLLLTAGLPWPTVLFTLLVDEIMIITGLVGALVVSNYKASRAWHLKSAIADNFSQWAYFVFGCAALAVVLWTLTITARKHASALGSDVSRVYLICGCLTSFLWLLYPIAWGICEGGNVIAPDSEAVFYGILDLLAKPVFGALLLWGHRNIDPARLGLHIRDYDEDPAIHGGVHSGGYTDKSNPTEPGSTSTDGAAATAV